jgi:hypothetical protein
MTNENTENGPLTAERPIMPEGYGVPDSTEGTLPWSYVVERMSTAGNYWVSTVRPDGRPHAMPVWGAWLDDRLYIEGDPTTVRHRNLTGNPNVVVHLENGSQVVIIEGVAEAVKNPPRTLGESLAADMGKKYASFGYTPGPDQWDGGGLFVIAPRKVFAWTEFPKDTTRWRFE